jgi:D-threonate/D-erythronate kinase
MTVEQLHRLGCMKQMPAPRLAIIADDLSGALDAAAPFAGVGSMVVAATGPDALGDALAGDAGIVAVSSRSRELDAGAARARVARILAALPPGIRILKKIDSRLKGNIAAELEPLADRPLVILPAIPDFGRVVRGGSLQGFGVDRPVAVRDVLGRLAATALVPDIADQCAMARAVAAAPADAVLVGARGLAQALASAMGMPAPAQPPPLPLPTCFVIGSTDPITLAQVAALRAARRDVLHIEAAGGTVPSLPPYWSPPPVVVLQATGGGESRPLQVAAKLARGAAPYLSAARSMLLTGGATAEAVLDVLRITLLTVAGEALPGMPFCRAAGRVVLTKSGGFGGPDTLVRLAAQAAKAEI